MKFALASAATIALAALLGSCGPDTANPTLRKIDPAARAQAAAPTACGGGAPYLTAVACAEPTIAALSASMSVGLTKLENVLSREGGQLLIDGQSQWLTGVRITCLLDPADKELSAEQSVCVQLSMIDRMMGLATMLQTDGPYTVQRVESFRVLPPPKTVKDKAATISVASYPRIDNPDAAGKAFNALSFREIRKDLPDDAEQTIAYQIAYADQNVISVEYDTLFAMRSGAAHQDRSVETLTFLLKDKRPLQAGDLFSTGTWQTTFVAMAEQKLKDAVIEEGCDAPLAKEYARDASLRADRWLISPDALTIVYPPYALGPYSLEGCKINMNWTDLAPLLRKDAPIPPRPAKKQSSMVSG